MQKSIFSVLTLSLGLIATSAHADLMPTQPLANNVESSNLANRVLDRDEQHVDSALFKMSTAKNNTAAKIKTINSLSIVETAGNRVTSENVPARIELAAKAAPANKDDDGIINRLSAVASKTVRKFNQTGLASWYGRQFHGRKTASGARFDMYAMTAAHRTLPLNCYIRVTNKSNGKSVVVKVNDRGPFHGNRVLDLSYAAANKLGITKQGVGKVTIERISPP